MVTLAEVPGTLLKAVVDALVPGRVERRTAGGAPRCWRLALGVLGLR